MRKEHNTNAYRAASEMQRVSLSTTLKIVSEAILVLTCSAHSCSLQSLTRPFIMMFRETIIFCMSIYLSFIYSLLYLLFFAFPIAFEEVRGWNPGTTGTAFVAVMVSLRDSEVVFNSRLTDLCQSDWDHAVIPGPAIPGSLVCQGHSERSTSRGPSLPYDGRFHVSSSGG